MALSLLLSLLSLQQRRCSSSTSSASPTTAAAAASVRRRHRLNDGNVYFYVLFFVLCIALHGQEAAADIAPYIVGNKYPVTLTNQDGSIPTETTTLGFLFNITHPGATYIALHFSNFSLVPGSVLIVSDAYGEQNYTLTGKGKMDAGTFWSQHIKGDTVLLHLISDSSDNGTPDTAGNFTIDEYAAGFVDLTEATCGTNDLKNIICFASTYPTEYAKARAVARLLINGNSLCTGWLASAQNHLITNEHCITTTSAALNTDYEFMAEAASCSLSNCQLCYKGTIFSGATWIVDDATLDYALVKINSGNPAATYGYLQMDYSRTIAVGETIYIPGHPNGRAKEMGIVSTHTLDTGGFCKIQTLSASSCANGNYNDVGYYCDTEGGNSGSPVLSRTTHKVVALHHCAGSTSCTNSGGGPNRGVPIALVYNRISSYIGCTSNANCDDGNVCTVDTCQAGGVCSNVVNPTCCKQNSDCNDNDICTTDTCDVSTGVCSRTNVAGCCRTNADCNDNNACTTDTCQTSTGVCSRPWRTGCCNGNADCNDNVVCTTDTCSATTNGTCSNVLIPTCCRQNSDCNDGDVCTTDTCNVNTGVCTRTNIPGCCRTNTDCNDNNPCTTDTCNVTTGVCSRPKIPGCCNTNADCNDNVVCTTDTCTGNTGNGGTCSNVVNPTCCTNDAFCNDNEICTRDTCQLSTGVCSRTPVANCCHTDADCQDNAACTTDICNLSTNQCTHPLVPGCCGNGMCEAGENCYNCGADCISGIQRLATCGNGICEAGNHENCVNCPQDCRGFQKGLFIRCRYCCGDGGGWGPVGCTNRKCTRSGYQCTAETKESVPYCCGDGICRGNENCSNCPTDCYNPTENCSDGYDNDCDGATDCKDSECTSTALCVAEAQNTRTCTASNQPCTKNTQCCSGRCKWIRQCA